MAAQEDKSAEATPKKVTPSVSSEQFPIERILSADECFALTGIERHIVVGALHNTNKTNLSTDEVVEAVDKWLSSPVKED